MSKKWKAFSTENINKKKSFLCSSFNKKKKKTFAFHNRKIFLSSRMQMMDQLVVNLEKKISVFLPHTLKRSAERIAASLNNKRGIK